MKALIVYYSYSGNTKKIAEMIQKKIGADAVQIETVVAYPDNYDAVVDQGHKEIAKGYCPEIKPLNVDLRDVDTVVLGTPVWWYTYAPALKTFLNSQNWQGKTVYPFATDGGWIGHTLKDIADVCEGADVKVGIDIHFNGARLKTAEKDIENWIETIK